MSTIKFTLYCIICILFLPFNSLGEGTKQLRPNETDFGYINLMDQPNNLGAERTFALYNADDNTRLNIRVIDASNELICIGFKTENTNDLYFRVKDPLGNIIRPESLVPQLDGQDGKIINYNQAIAGPNLVNIAGYTPITIIPTPGLSGDYSIEFNDPTHAPPLNYAKRNLELFDITVIDITNNVALQGRLWSKAWDVTTTALDKPFNGSVYIYTNDGITTKATFNYFEAWSFIIQSNSTGPRNTGDIENDRKSINGGTLLPEYKIFLNEPDTLAFPPSLAPNIIGTPSIDLCSEQQEYCIEIELSNPGVINYILDIDGDIGYDHPRDIMLSEYTSVGTNCLPWDGKDGLGASLSSSDSFNIILNYQAGITHLFLHDAENNPSGFSVNHISPKQGLGDPLLFYDDSDASINGNSELNGCSGFCHVWNNNFGNNKTINTWWVTYFENDTLFNLSSAKSYVKSNV